MPLTDPLVLRGGLATAPLGGRPSSSQAPAVRRSAHSLASLAPLSRPLEAAAAPLRPPRDLRAFADPASSAFTSPSSPSTAGLSGRWRKDRAASDDMGPACDAVALPWVLRKAIGLVKVLVVDDTPAHFQTRLKAGILDIVETYPWNAEAEVEHGRRDKRRGGHRGRVERVPPDVPGGAPGAAIHVRWNDPYGGTCVDTFTVTPDGRTLIQATEMVMAADGAVVSYKTVYRREREQQR